MPMMSKNNPKNPYTRPMAEYYDDLEAGFEPKMISVLQLTDSTCKYPFGAVDAEKFGFCGHGKHQALPYCHRHMVKSKKNGTYKIPEEDKR